MNVIWYITGRDISGKKISRGSNSIFRLGLVGKSLVLQDPQFGNSRDSHTLPASGRPTRYKWYEPPRDLLRSQNDDVLAGHPSFSEDGFGAGGISEGVD